MGDPAAHYPTGTVRALLSTDLVTPATRRVLVDRLAAEHTHALPRFFSLAEHATLSAVVHRLLPQGARTNRIDIASAIDHRLASGKCKGWRYDTLPADTEAFTHALAGIDDEADHRHGTPFTALSVDDQDALLLAVQQGGATSSAWSHVDARRFFEELLAESAEIYFADPVVQEEIGFVGMADAHGFHAIGLDRLEPHEPRALE